MKKFKIILITIILSLSSLTQSYSKPVPDSFADLAEKMRNLTDPNLTSLFKRVER